MRGIQDRTCVRCGKVFPGTIRAQYCSPKCKVYAYRERKDAEKGLGHFGPAVPIDGKVPPFSALTPEERAAFREAGGDIDCVPAGEE